MRLAPLYGHEELRERLLRHAVAGTLPASILLHGPKGVGKQRLALWLAQAILCTSDEPPCGECQACKYSLVLGHPDLRWYFPRPRPKDTDPSLEDVREDFADAIRDRLENGGLYEPPSGSEGIFVATVRAIVQEAGMSPAMGRRKVFVIGDAERMVPQEGTEFAANAFLKLLEEPLPDTTLILTSSEPGQLLPTIRSRAVAVRVPRVSDDAVRKFLADPQVREAMDSSKESDADLVRAAAGAPGRLFGGEARSIAMTAARKLMDAASSGVDSRIHAASLSVGLAGARGAFTETLDSLLLLLGERMRAALHEKDGRQAARASRAATLVERAREQARGNVNPQLITSRLLREISAILT
jgi:DNA polymerase-3 subunit delta'